jgi:hypothetical protein
MRVPRTRGAVSGALIAILGAWSALIPFIGPSFNYAIGPSDAWHWTSGRLWLSVIPGAVAVIGGLILMTSARRPTASLGAVLGVLAGIWLIAGPTVSELWNHGVSQAGTAHGSNGVRVLEQLGWFLAPGALILYFGAAALGRLSIRSVRDIELAEGEAAAAGTTGYAAGTAPAAAEAPATRQATTPGRRRRGFLRRREAATTTGPPRR